MRILSIFLFLVLSLNASDKLKIYFDAGGSVGESYATVISNGAKVAAKDLGVDLRIYYSDWNPNKMVENFKNALGVKPDGIVIMGHPGDELFEPFVKKAISQGVVVTSIDTGLPKLNKTYASRGFGYVGTDNYTSGISMGNEVLNEFSLKKGDKVLVWGLLAQPIRGLRAKGIIEVLEKNGIKVEYIEISDEVNKDPSLGFNIFSAYMLKNPDTKLAITDHGSLTAQMTQFMKSLKINPNKLQVAGFSLSPATIAGMKEGYIDLIGDGQPFVQGYLSIWQVVMTKKYAFSGFSVDTGGGYVRAANLKTIEPLIKNAIR